MRINKQIIFAIVLGVIVGITVILHLKSGQTDRGQTPELRNPSTTAPRPSLTLTKNKDQTTQPTNHAPVDPTRASVLEDLIRRWEEMKKCDKGEALLAKQHNLALEAVKLGASDEFLRFLRFLGENGAGDIRTQITAEIGEKIFSGANAKEARAWLVSVADFKLREKFGYLAGKGFTGEGLKEYIALFHPDDHTQSSILVGFCRELAQSDPVAGAKTFLELRPSNVTMEGYVEIMAALPPTANFAKFSAELPADSKTIARMARTALLQSWSTTQPEDAAQYVLANSTLAFPEQMAVVVEKWAKKSPEAATVWIETLSPGKPRDEGMAALARNWIASDPVKAWEVVGKVGEFNKRVETATTVFKEWEKIDRTAATNAWVALFPAGN